MHCATAAYGSMVLQGTGAAMQTANAKEPADKPVKGSSRIQLLYNVHAPALPLTYVYSRQSVSAHTSSWLQHNCSSSSSSSTSIEQETAAANSQRKLPHVWTYVRQAVSVQPCTPLIWHASLLLRAWSTKLCSGVKLFK
jgi:hypothetical protein